LSAARILIVTNGHLCRNPRPLKEATALGQAGHDVTVLSVRNHAPSEIVDAEILRTAPFRRVVVDAAAGFHGDSALVVWSRRVRQWLARQATARFGLATIESLGPGHALLSVAVRNPADLTIVHNEVPHWLGTRLLARGRRVGADLEDWHSEDLLPSDRAGRPITLLRTVENALLHRADYTTTTSHALADALHARYGGRRPHVIANAFPLQPLRARDRAAPPSFFWFSQTLGPGRGLECFLDAWAVTRTPSRLVLLGESRGDYAAAILARLPADFQSRVSFLPLVSPAELPSLIARHDIGLALEQSSIPNRNLTITNKIIQYLDAGLAVVATDTAGQREVLAHSPAAGIVVAPSETAVFASALETLLADRAALAARQQAARRLAETVYNWELEAPRLCALVADALSRPRNLPA
jgi:glycosyltransferase involved in cell wall biosynthesis